MMKSSPLPSLILNEKAALADWEMFYQSKIISPDGLYEKVAKLKERGQTIVTINGAFDLLHAGHLFFLHAASKQADHLICALNSDQSIHTYKSPQRPIVPLPYRLQQIAALAFVDTVTWFEDADPIALLDRLQPDVHVNGTEYGANCIERATVEKNGGRICLVPRIDGLATSDLISKICAL